MASGHRFSQTEHHHKHMTLISKIISGSATKQLRDRVAAAHEDRARLAGFAERANKEAAAVDKLRSRFFETLAEADFNEWHKARQRLDSLKVCSQDAGQALAWRPEAALDTGDVRELILGALRDSAATLNAQVSELAQAERERLIAAGVEDPAENPSVTKLRARARELLDCHVDLTGRENNWQPHKGRYLAALGIH